MNFYRRIINIGQRHTADNLVKKKIALLNTYIVIWMHLSLFFILLDLLFNPPNQLKDIGIHTVSLCVLSFLIFLNKINQFNLSRVLYITLSFIIFYILSFVITFSPYTICYFIFLPMVVMSLYKSNVPSYFFLALCLLTYAWSDLWMLEQITVNQYIRAVVLLKDPVVTSLFIAGFYLFYYFKKLNQKSEEQLEIAYQKLEKTQKGELAHLQLKSLKAQMNPHFMFNAMNSIQSMVLKGDKHNAYQYLSKFSEMVRDNLNMSEKSFVSFDEENSLLKKYLELEKLRFRNDFSYKITGGNLVDDLKIPSMIIQPFVENAIKHGLLHKVNGQKQLHIEFKQKEVFECIITDNGVGVQKCKEINIQNKIEHTSFSTNAIKERLALLKDYYKTDIGFEYIAVAKGTQVVVKIPYTLK